MVRDFLLLIFRLWFSIAMISFIIICLHYHASSGIRHSLWDSLFFSCIMSMFRYLGAHRNDIGRIFTIYKNGMGRILTTWSSIFLVSFYLTSPRCVRQRISWHVMWISVVVTCCVTCHMPISGDVSDADLG